ncbi:hypothetical protein BC628DRAFT_434932 [Trametes gibbosa]|nr:hypothetical protein BC628DRAFT_434932 [Trametes gibbosa]
MPSRRSSLRTFDQTVRCARINRARLSLYSSTITSQLNVTLLCVAVSSFTFAYRGRAPENHDAQPDHAPFRHGPALCMVSVVRHRRMCTLTIGTSYCGGCEVDEKAHLYLLPALPAQNPTQRGTITCVMNRHEEPTTRLNDNSAPILRQSPDRR